MDTSERQRLNAGRLELFGSDPSRLIAFICECGLPGCRKTVLLTAEQYVARSPGAVVHPEHGLPAGPEPTGGLGSVV